MFQFELHRNSGISTAWLLSTIGAKTTNKRVKKRDILSLKVPDVCNSIARTSPYMLRVTSSLMYGAVMIYDRKVRYLRDDLSSLCSSILRQNAREVTAEEPYQSRTDIQLENDPRFTIERLVPRLPVFEDSISSLEVTNTSIENLLEIPNTSWEVDWDAYAGVDDLEPMEFVFDEQGDISHTIDEANLSEGIAPRELSALPEVTEPEEILQEPEGPPRKRPRLALVSDLDNLTTFSHAEYREFYDNYVENMTMANSRPRRQARENLPIREYTSLLLGEPFAYAFQHYTTDITMPDNVLRDAPVVPSTPASVEVARQRAGSVEHLSGGSRASSHFSFDMPRRSTSPLSRRDTFDGIVPVEFNVHDAEESDEDMGEVNKEVAMSLLSSIKEPTLFSDLSYGSTKSEKVSLFYQLLCLADRDQLIPDQLPNGDIMILLV